MLWCYLSQNELSYYIVMFSEFDLFVATSISQLFSQSSFAEGKCFSCRSQSDLLTLFIRKKNPSLPITSWQTGKLDWPMLNKHTYAFFLFFYSKNAALWMDLRRLSSWEGKVGFYSVHRDLDLRSTNIFLFLSESTYSFS